MLTHAVPAPLVPAIDPPMFETTVSADVLPPLVVMAAAPDATIGRDGCELTDSIRAALVASPATPGALAAIPGSARTVANAVMLWDGRWLALPLKAGGNGLNQLRDIVIASIRAAPADCRAAAVSGPRLIFVPDGATTVVLAFGSGTWAWAELLG